MSNVLHAHYVFYSSATGNTYVLSLTTQPLTSGIKTLDNPNCEGYPIISGTFTKVNPDGTSSGPYSVPGGQVMQIYNGLWPNAAQCPSGAGAPLCQGIDRLFINFTSENNNTLIFANDSNNITVEFGTSPSDTAQLLHAIFPPATA